MDLVLTDQVPDTRGRNHDLQRHLSALAIDARLIGVNNRDLTNFTVDLGATEHLAKRITESGGAEKVLVAESGIHSRADVERLEKCGARAILVGTSLMRQPDISAKAAELLG